MKRIKKLAALMMAAMMALAMGITAFAQTKPLDPADTDNAKITINNAARGETYTIYKLFDATVGEGGQIAYQCPGDIPSQVSAFFTKDSSNNVIPADSILEKDADGKITGTTKMTPELRTALEAWAATATKTNSAVSDGSALEFTGLPYGYYVMTTTHESDAEDAEDGEDAKAAITVTSTQPNASIFDKNVNEPSVTKTVEKESYSIGDTVKYTATFDTTNYMGEGADAKQVINYLISDTLPEFLSDATITKITIGGTEYKVDGAVPKFENKQIMIPWATKETDGSYTSLYAQGAQIVMTYKAVLTSTTNINAVDTNTVSIRPYVDKGPGTPEGGDPWDEDWKDTAEIATYAAAIKKVDQDDNPLAGAEFTIAGLTVEEVKDENDETQAGVYRVVSYNPDSTTASATMVTDSDGKLYIVGLAKDVILTVTEVKAPDGYNKLTETKELKPQELSKTIYETSGERHYDKDGNLVSESVTGETTTEIVSKNLSDLDVSALKIVNNQGSLLPSTGGIGTTIFYIVGAVLVIGAGVILVAKKRMSKEV